MPACDYCEESFDDETACLDHLAATHGGELSRIDQRRVEARASDEDERSLTTYAVVGLALALIAGLGAVGVGGLDLGTQTDEYGLPTEGSHPALDDLESFEQNGRTHVARDVDYQRVPPLSGPHANTPASAGFYDQTPRLESLVHSLEHGAVVIYYDPAAVSDDTRSRLRDLPSEFDDPFASVIVAPHPADDPPADVTLTAWRHRLRLDAYDADAVEAFLADYLGRGPERPVR